LDLSAQVSRLLGRLRLTLIAGKFWPNTSPTRSDSKMYESAELITSDPLTLSPAVFPARTLATLVSEPESTESARDSGENSIESLASYDRDSCSWRTSQLCFHLSSETDGSSQLQFQEYLETWPKSGTTQSGRLYLLQTSALRTLESEFGSSHIPTPSACDHKGSGRPRKDRGPGKNLRDWFRQNYGFLYPPVRAVEYAMGYPIEYTTLEHSETP